MKNLILYILLISSVQTFAQYSEDLSSVRPTFKDTVETKADSDQEPTTTSDVDLSNFGENAVVDSVIDVLADQNTKVPHNQTKGYRIQVYSGERQMEAQEMEDKLNELDIAKEHKVYKLFESGFIWRVKVGDFETRLDAYRVYKKLKNDFPNCLLVPERKINLVHD